MAEARGVTPGDVAYERFLKTDGKGIVLAAQGSYGMPAHPHCVPGSSDRRMHYGAICDVSSPLEKLEVCDRSLRWIRYNAVNLTCLSEADSHRS